MGNSRDVGKQMIGLWCEPEFLEQIDTARGFRGRSQFCREAIREMLLRLDYDVPEKSIMPRDTVGRPRKRSETPVFLNESPTPYRVTEPPDAAVPKPPTKPSKKTPKNPTL